MQTTERTAIILPTGTWDIDPAHSLVEFSVRHLMVSKVKGRFGRFSGTITVGDEPAEAAVEATIDVSSIDTNDPKRDAHLRSADFLDVETHPTATFASRAVRAAGDGYVLTGDFSLHGVTRPVELRLDFNGSAADPWGGTRAGFSASTELNRRDFGVDISMPLANGGAVVGDKITVNLEIEAVARLAA